MQNALDCERGGEGDDLLLSQVLSLNHMEWSFITSKMNTYGWKVRPRFLPKNLV